MNSSDCCRKLLPLRRVVNLLTNKLGLTHAAHMLLNFISNPASQTGKHHHPSRDRIRFGHSLQSWSSCSSIFAKSIFKVFFFSLPALLSLSSRILLVIYLYVALDSRHQISQEYWVIGSCSVYRSHRGGLAHVTVVCIHCLLFKSMWAEFGKQKIVWELR